MLNSTYRVVTQLAELALFFGGAAALGFGLLALR